MRSARHAWLFVILFLVVPSWGKQAPQQASTPQPASDPQAVAVLQAAITALGGATAIGQGQDWDFQSLSDGPLDGGNNTETISFQVPNASIVVNGVSGPAPKFVSSSLFIPVLAGAILLQELQDSNYEVHFDGVSTLASKPVNVVKFLVTSSQALTQIWVFDAATGLPARVFFESPAQIGQTKSFRALVDLSDYRAVSGVLYPFSVVTYMEGSLPETLSLQSVTPSANASPTPTGSTTGVYNDFPRLFEPGTIRFAALSVATGLHIAILGLGFLRDPGICPRPTKCRRRHEPHFHLSWLRH